MPLPKPGQTAPTTMIGLDQVSSICTTRHPANIMTGVILRLLQEHFANADNLEYNGLNEFADQAGLIVKRQLQEYIWDADTTRTQIQIQPVWLWNTEDIQRRPALYVKRNRLTPQRIAIDDGGMHVKSVKDESGRVVRVEGRYYTQMVMGSHTVFVVAQSGAEAELLGQEVFNHLMMFGPAIRSDMKLHRFQVVENGEVSLLEEFNDNFVVPIVASYAFFWAWRIQEVAPWLKSLAVDVVSNP